MSDAEVSEDAVWHRVLDLDELPEGRVKPVSAGHKQLAMTHHDGSYGALDNRCPHQGGPLGEGAIENGLLRCPWHGWDYCPLTGKPPGSTDFDDGVEAFPVEVRDGGVWVAVPPEAPHVRTVSDVMAETMVNWGVEVCFGMVGHSNLGLADAIRLQAEAGKLRYVGIRHEGAAAFAASAYGKLTGKPAACLTIAGPGATNLLTGMWDAHVDRSPLLALTGQVNTQVMGPGAFQEIDLASAFESVAPFSHTVLHGSSHSELMSLACKHALVERRPSHLIFPDEVQNIEAPGAPAKLPDGRLAEPEIAPPQASLEAALKRLRKAKRPVFIVGHGARFAMAEVIDLAEDLGAPVITTFKAKGQISDSHPLAGGVLGRSGTPIASWLMNEADLLVVWGASFSDHTGITPKIPIVQIDFERMQLGRVHRIHTPVWGEVGVTARLLREAIAGGTDSEDQRGDVAARWEIWREEKRRRVADDRGKGLNSASIFAALSDLAPADAVIAVDVGNNTYSFGRYFESEGQPVLMSGYLGSIGFAYPAAIGAWAAVAAEGRKVIAISGDGGFGQYMGEITTAVKYGMDITHVLLNNSELGKISKEQRAGEWDVWETNLHNPDFAAYAQLCGAHGARVTERDGIEPAIAEALAVDGPATVELVTDAELV